MKNPIGIIGLGLLGRAVADRLTEKGFIVAGFDIVTPKSQEVNMLPNAVEVFNTCSTVVFSLPTRSTSLQVAAQVSKVLSPKHLVIDTATGNPEETLALANELATCGAGYLEANVAGSSEQLRNGGAALFLGGTEKVVSDCQPLLDALTTRRFHIGSVGAASQFKLVHNLILGLHRATLAEGLQFAEALGLEPGTVLEILRQTPAISGVMDTKGLKSFPLKLIYAELYPLPPHLRWTQGRWGPRLSSQMGARGKADVPQMGDRAAPPEWWC